MVVSICPPAGCTTADCPASCFLALHPSPHRPPPSLLVSSAASSEQAVLEPPSPAAHVGFRPGDLEDALVAARERSSATFLAAGTLPLSAPFSALHAGGGGVARVDHSTASFLFDGVPFALDSFISLDDHTDRKGEHTPWLLGDIFTLCPGSASPAPALQVERACASCPGGGTRLIVFFAWFTQNGVLDAGSTQRSHSDAGAGAARRRPAVAASADFGEKSGRVAV